MLGANLKMSSSHPPKIAKTFAFEGLDPSEKTGISYFFGLTVAKIIAERLLNAPWPQHVDKFAGLITPPLSRRERPDLIAQDRRGKWLVLEAKGRSNALDSKTISKAKKQVNALQAINGKAPRRRVVAGSYFANGNLRAILRDPREAKGRAVLDISEEVFIRNYYEPLVSLLFSREQSPRSLFLTNDLSFRITRLGEIDVTVGIADQILTPYHANEGLHRAALSLAARLPPNTEGPESRTRQVEAEIEHPVSSFNIGQDAIFVALGPSWSDEQLALEPVERRPIS